MIYAPLLKIMAIKWSVIIGLRVLANRIPVHKIETGQFIKIPKGFQ